MTGMQLGLIDRGDSRDLIAKVGQRDDNAINIFTLLLKQVAQILASFNVSIAPFGVASFGGMT